MIIKIKIIGVLLLVLALVNCSDETTSNEDKNDTTFPNVTSVNLNEIMVGETITVEGEFDISQKHTVYINDLECEIIVINPNTFTFKLPLNAVSGEITLNVNDETKSIGKVTIFNPIFGMWRLSKDDQGKDVDNCEENTTLEVFDNGTYSRANFYFEIYIDDDGNEQTACNGDANGKEKRYVIRLERG